MRKLQVSLLTVCALLLTGGAFAQQPGGDPLSGTWNHESRNGDFKITKK